MGKRGGRFMRRTVLQIGDEAKKQPSYGFGYKPDETGAVGGLVAQYGDGDDDDGHESDEDDSIHQQAGTHTVFSRPVPQMFVAASGSDLPPPPPPLPAEKPAANGDGGKPKGILKQRRDLTPKSILKVKKEETSLEGSKSNTTGSKNTEAAIDSKPKVKDEVDEKLKDFLAEIDALEPNLADGASDCGSQADIDGQAMTPPTLDGSHSDEGEWQEVTDDSADEKDPEPQPPKEPTTPWQHCLDEQSQYYYYWNISTNEVTWQIPESYSQYLLLKKEYETVMSKYSVDKKAWEERRKHKPKKYKKVFKKKLRDPPKEAFKPPPPDVRSKSTPKDVVSKPAPVVSSVTPLPTEAPPVVKEETAAEKTSEKHHHHHHKHSKDKKKAKKSSKHAEPVTMGPALPPATTIGPHLPPPPPPEDEDATVEKEVEVKREVEVVVEKTDEPGKTSGTGGEDGEEEDDFIHQQLEEPVFTHYEYVNRKYQEAAAPPSVPSEKSPCDTDGFEMDLEDIDRELEMALHRKQEVLAETEDQKTAQAPGVKRAAPTELDPPPPGGKRCKTEEDETHISQQQHGTYSDSGSRRLLRDDIKVKVDSLAEASELANLVVDKLDFLEVHRRGLSDLQVLLIQLETRIEDWKLGGLNTEYLLVKLRLADHELQKYEKNAAPPGWTCNWHRAFKKYFYFNEITGASQWEYPATDSADEQLAAAKQQLPIADQRVAAEHQQSAVAEKELVAPFEQQLAEGGVVSEQQLLQQPAVEEDTDKQQRSVLDFAQLAEAPPPPPGEPPPPGTETRPLSPPEPALSNLIGYDDSLSDSSSSSEDSEEDRRKRRRRRSRSSSTDDSPPDYDPTEPTNEKEEKDVTSLLSSDTTIELPVHSKPVHIAAQPVIKAPVVVEAPPTMPENQELAEDLVKPLPEENIEQSKEEGGALMESLANENGAEEVPDAVNQEIEGGASKESKTHSSRKKKKEKKDKHLSGGGLSMKRKGMSSMVQKWKKVAKDVESKPPKVSLLPVEEGDMELE